MIGRSLIPEPLPLIKVLSIQAGQPTIWLVEPITEECTNRMMWEALRDFNVYSAFPSDYLWTYTKAGMRHAVGMPNLIVAYRDDLTMKTLKTLSWYCRGMKPTQLLVDPGELTATMIRMSMRLQHA